MNGEYDINSLLQDTEIKYINKSKGEFSLTFKKFHNSVAIHIFRENLTRNEIFFTERLFKNLHKFNFFTNVDVKPVFIILNAIKNKFYDKTKIQNETKYNYNVLDVDCSFERTYSGRCGKRILKKFPYDQKGCPDNF